ncbi:IclR family transcriptional regulator C-terminal domain-containing protein [Streptomyces sp. TLI_105]|uniref:IclR family transcriptional regulator domain-containing protein n=1 Tax=Streptomyces sp. TLI_105 TaxID=1881019 RepID=UPI00089D7F76|nr:IclR family transcriptional regulator C-terminal domain-containing protein [Streptomyces sp. TLI_105]SEE59498.1 DNA-binding transcriptional regulator, IclR family [Streptomyces sp. TLI_105]
MSRFNQDSGGRPAPEAGAALLTLMNQLTGPPDFWDRPDGDFGPLTHLYKQDVEGRERANAHYRLGSKALRRGELSTAADWLGTAASAGHPGALLRLAVVVLRANACWTDDAWFLVEEAARHGHGDAERLLDAAAGRTPGPGALSQTEDTSFFEELRRLLGIPLQLLQPDPYPAPFHPDRHPSTAPEASRAADPEGEERQPGQTGLVLVPAPTLPKQYGPAPRPRTLPDTDRPRLTALAGGLTLPVPDLSPTVPVRPFVVHGSVDLRGEPWWSARALRPAVLTDMARHSTTPAVVPARWQATQRARDVLLLIHDADGIDTRALARRSQMPMNQIVRLLDWLRGEQFVDTVGGAHFPGPLMKLATASEQEHTLLQDTLASLRDELSAAVYVSTYTEGEITVRESSSSQTAPPVEEVAPFSVTGHASANGKSLLAQLDFASRMDHLSRYPSVQLTGRTITSRHTLIEELDGPGPHSAQFDLLEYSEKALCVAFSLGLPRRASSIALSLPVHQHLRLIDAARTLSRRATGILLAHLLSEDMQQSTDHHEGNAWPPTAPEPRRALP